MLKFMIPNKFEQEELTWVEETNKKYDNKIVQLFGSLASDSLGSVRERYRLPDMKEAEFKKYINDAHSIGVEIAYTLNLSCFGNFKDLYEKKDIINYIKWLEDCGIKQVIVANPAIAEIITENSNLNIEVSTVAYINSLHKLKFWVDNFRVNMVCPDFSINRNFKVLTDMRKMLDVQVMVNEPCLYNCPMRQFHNNMQSHVTEKSDIKDNWPLRVCIAMKQTDKAGWIKCPFVRPQDLKVYENECNINNFKIVGRTFPLWFVKKSVIPYMEEYYDGNLLDLIPLLQNIQKEDHTFPLYIDCKGLDDFISFFKLGKDCFYGCGDCDYCDRWAEKVIKEVK